MEIWKDIEGYEKLYQVSNFGRVKSISRNIIMKTYLKKNGKYEKITLAKNNVKKHYSIHRLVAKAFIPNPNKYPCVNHKDENGLNNYAR